MLNGWTETPTSVHELPWNIKAGRRVMWWIELPVCEEYPAKSFAIMGSLQESENRQVILDKENFGLGGYYYESATAYKEIGKGPHDE